MAAAAAGIAIGASERENCSASRNCSTRGFSTVYADNVTRSYTQRGGGKKKKNIGFADNGKGT